MDGTRLQRALVSLVLIVVLVAATIAVAGPAIAQETPNPEPSPSASSSSAPTLGTGSPSESFRRRVGSRTRVNRFVLEGGGTTAGGTATTSADPRIIMPFTGTAKVAVNSRDAANTLELGLQSPQSFVICGNCFPGNGGIIGTFTGGTELVLYLADRTVRGRWPSTDTSHARVQKIDPRTWRIAWDDGGGGGRPDSDFNDLVTTVSVEAGGSDATYVAMGDSYQSGVGTGEYYDTPCLRSPVAYAPKLATEINVSIPYLANFHRQADVPFDLRFVACGGATTDTLTGYLGEPSQYDALDEHTGLVTIGIGGNDIGFGPRLQNCILTNFVLTSCADEYDAAVRADLATLTDPDSSGLNKLQQVYARIQRKAPYSGIFVLGYPRFFPYEGGWDLVSSIWPGLITRGLGVEKRCANLRVTDQLWINDKIRDLDDAIRFSAESMGARYVDLYNAPEGREICNDGGDAPFMNGITTSTGLDDSFHPTVLGHEIITDILRGELQDHGFGATFVVHPRETVTTTRSVDGDTPITFSTVWPGSDVEMTLVTPSGEVIGRSTTSPGIFHQAGPTSEVYYIENPEPGEWTVRLYGLDVDAAGEDVGLDFYQAPEPNRDPVAAMTMSRSGRTVTLDASGSHDPDGEIVDYVWEFDDGTVATGTTVTHTYPAGGTYRVTLAVVDDRDGVGFAMADHDVVVPPYAFDGFYRPVDNAPTVNLATAGRAVPVKFSLGVGEGLDILNEGHPSSNSIDCMTGAALDAIEETVAPGATELSYDATTNTYTYVWKTDASWAGTCRRFVLGLNDRSRHEAYFKFK
ncbi:MAG: PxKF domain-containing protein [Actinomycetota bacterium]|nr:PxKF domain-containing protein [Actinomycetota bacterium]